MLGRSEDQRDLLDVESVAGHLLKPGSVFAFLAEHRRELFPEELFTDLFPSSRGRPSVPAEVMATVIMLQALNGLSDSETVDAVTFDLRWKAAVGWPIDEAAFHSTTLTYWRRRLAASDRPNRIFDAVKDVVARTGVLKGKTRRALDSTVLDDAVATQDTVTQLIAAIRRVRRVVPDAVEVVTEWCTAHDYDDPGKPSIAWDDTEARARLVDALVGDALRLLGHLPETEHGPEAAEALALLALIAGQDVEPVTGGDGTDGRWRIRQGVAKDRVISVVDPDARHAHKTVSRRQDGFKAHLAVEPDTGLVTGCELTKAAGAETSDATVGVDLLTRDDTLDAAGGDVEVLGDSAYGTGDALAAILGAGHVPLVKPWPTKPAVPGGLDIDEFTVDEATGTATCPAGITRRIPPTRHVMFGAACRDCPLRARCTTARKGRMLTLHDHDALQREHRQRAKDPQWQADYRQHRPMVERSIAWLVRGPNRKLRYRGVTKNNQWLHTRAAGLNLRRLISLGLDHSNGNWVIA